MEEAEPKPVPRVPMGNAEKRYNIDKREVRHILQLCLDEVMVFTLVIRRADLPDRYQSTVQAGVLRGAEKKRSVSAGSFVVVGIIHSAHTKNRV